MPLPIFRRDGEPSAASSLLARRGHGRFEGLNEEWRISAVMRADRRLGDALNRREPVPISDVLWGPVDGSAPLQPAPGIRTVDPYDIIVAMAGRGCVVLSEADLESFAIHRIAYDVWLDAAPFNVTGTVHLEPGADPAKLLDRASELFVPVTRPVIHLNDVHLRNAPTDVVLLNRSYLRDVKRERRLRDS